MTRILALCLAACSSPSPAPPPPACLPDGYLIATAPCVVSCVVDETRHAFGSCDEPDELTSCVTFMMGEAVAVVRLNGAASAEWDEFEDEECGP